MSAAVLINFVPYPASVYTLHRLRQTVNYNLILIQFKIIRTILWVLMIKCSVKTKTAAIIRYIFSLYRFQQIGSRSDKTKMIRQDPFLQHCLHLLIANRYSVAVGTGIGYSSLIIQYNDIRIWSCLDVFCRIRTQKIICRYRITGSGSGCFKNRIWV